MNILFDDEHLKIELIKYTDFNNIIDLKTSLKRLILDYLMDILLPPDKIENIIISTDGNFGLVVPNYQLPLNFNIRFSKYPILFVFNTKLNKVLYGKSIIFHELQHCKEILITSTKVDIGQIDRPECYSLTNHYLYLGYHQWSEYYAYYHSAFIYPAAIKSVDKFHDILKNIEIFKSYKSYDAIIIHETHYQSNIEPFVRNAIILISHLKAGVNSDAERVLKEFISIDENIKIYFDIIIQLFDNFYQNYPENVSYNNFIELGESLLTF